VNISSLVAHVQRENLLLKKLYYLLKRTNLSDMYVVCTDKWHNIHGTVEQHCVYQSLTLLITLHQLNLYCYS
jgi:hypothetical protein